MEEKGRGSSRSRHTCAQNSGARESQRAPSSFAIHGSREKDIPPSCYCYATVPERSRIAAFPSDGTRFPCLLHHTTRGAPRTAAMKTSKLVPIVVFADLVKFHGPHFCPIVLCHCMHACAPVILLYSGARKFFRRSGPNIVYRDGLKYGCQVP